MLETASAFHRGRTAEILLGAQHELRHAHLAGLLHRLDQQRVRLGGAPVGHQVVRALVIDGIDLLEIDEILDLDRLGRARIERFQFFARDRDVAALGDLESLDDVLPRHFLPVGAADALLLDARAVLVVEHVEADLFGRGRREQLHGDADQAEADRTAPDRPRHLQATSLASGKSSSSGGACSGRCSILSASTPKYLNSRTWCCRSPSRWMVLSGIESTAVASTAMP